MLKNTFIHIPGIGIKTEKRFWEFGIQHWNRFSGNPSIHLSPARKDVIRTSLEESHQHFESGDPTYFSERMPANLHWRFFPEFRDSTVYLDIETTGLKMWGFEITTISLYDGKSIYYYIKGQNLDSFLDRIKKYKVIVTYNGKSFDVPFIESHFGITLNHAHIDLRYILYSLGYAGGLKRCEIQLGMDRGDLSDIDGYFAVLLWYEYQINGNKRALDTLLAYNIQDVLNLENLMVIAYNLKIKNTPFYENQLPEPVLPENPFEVDRMIVEKIKGEMGFGYGNFL
jgi:uncharacterized protein YprB with RNaseH-like and TPR domain